MKARVPFRLVVVDDDERVRRVVVEWLAGDQRFEVVGEAADGEAAVSMATRLQPDAVLLDLRMPRMSGDVALRHIRMRSPHTAVVVLTGHDELLQEARRLGADGVFPKGASLGVALDALASAVARRRIGRSTGT